MTLWEKHSHICVVYGKQTASPYCMRTSHKAHLADNIILNSSEASSIPTLLVASTVHHTDPNISPLPASKTHAGQHTFYQDGAWVSIDESYGTTYDKGDEFSEMDSQEMYYRQLVCRFKILRRRLTRLGARTVVRLDAEASQLSTIRPPSTRHEWLYTIDREYPTPTQVSQLNDKDIKRGLEYCAHAMDRFNTISKQKSCWIWTLLALSGDIGTLDSQKISHIRDLGSRAGEMSTSLRGTPNNESEEVRNQSLRTDPIEDGEYDQPETQADKSTSSGVGADAHDREKGYVQFDTGKRLESVPETALSRALLESRDDMQPLRPGTSSLNDSSGNNRPSDTDNDHATLEQARARLLAQLGDNLVQAGIPASAPDVDQIHQSHSEQIDQGSDGSQQEVQIRAIPSRTEAEMQRQLMRKRDSAPTSTGRSEHVHVLQPSADSYAGDVNTRVAIDMILTVVGECYGQRDLLRYRKPW